MWRCELCGTVFKRPALRRERVRMPDGYSERQTLWTCPGCGAEETYFDGGGGPWPWRRRWDDA